MGKKSFEERVDEAIYKIRASNAFMETMIDKNEQVIKLLEKIAKKFHITT